MTDYEQSMISFIISVTVNCQSYENMQLRKSCYCSKDLVIDFPKAILENKLVTMTTIEGNAKDLHPLADRGQLLAAQFRHQYVAGMVSRPYT